jgi:hypothetical protein
MMSEAEEYYARQNEVAKMTFTADLLKICDDWHNMASNQIRWLTDRWKLEHDEEPDRKIIDFWRRQREVAFGRSIHCIWTRRGAGQHGFAPGAMHETPPKGTDARRVWDSTKRRTAARRRKKSNEVPK